MGKNNSTKLANKSTSSGGTASKTIKHLKSAKEELEKVKLLAKKVSHQQKLIKSKAMQELEERKTTSLSKKELRDLKKEKKEALRQFTLKKAQLQLKKNKQVREEWNRIQDSLLNDMKDEDDNQKEDKVALQRMESLGWKVRTSFEADSSLLEEFNDKNESKTSKINTSRADEDSESESDYDGEGESEGEFDGSDVEGEESD